MRFDMKMFCGAALALALSAGTGTVQAQGRGNGGGTPPGLAKKPHGMPPGQAKKIYRPDEGLAVLRDVFGRNGYIIVRVASVDGARHVYFRKGRSGQVQRAIIRPGTERLVFVDVPTLILREVIARLY
jgi:hypothetical protein